MPFLILENWFQLGESAMALDEVATDPRELVVISKAGFVAAVWIAACNWDERPFGVGLLNASYD